MSKYPIQVKSSIIQYDEHVFVWTDETENVGGAAPTLEEAQREMERYAVAMGLTDTEDENK